MSSTRDALEATQQRMAQLQARDVPDEVLARLADELERELDAWARTVEKTEARVARSERSGLAASVMGFGFAVVFAGPIVAMLGTVLGRALRNEPALAVACLALGAAVVGLSWWKRARVAVAHRLSPEWRLLRQARAAVERLRSPTGERVRERG